MNPDGSIVGTALVVDDDEAVRLVTSEMLKRISCEATCAEGGVEALALLGERVFDVVFLDVGMPVMSGVEVYAQIRLTMPSQKVVFMTGYSKEEITDLGNRYTWILPKPYSLQDLSEMVQDVLGS